MKKPIVLIIRDGWGYRKSTKNNAIAQGKTEYTDFLMKNYPNTLIKASGSAVGLPNGYQGNGAFQRGDDKSLRTSSPWSPAYFG